MNERQFELLQYAMHIMETRATDPDRPVETRNAYDSAICMIGYALNENYECLSQFDYTKGGERYAENNY